MAFRCHQGMTRKEKRRMNQLLDEVIAEVNAKKKAAAAFDSEDLCINPDHSDSEDLCINPDHSTPYTTRELIADCKLAMMFKSPRERRQIAKDIKVLKRQLEEEQGNQLVAAAVREDNNRSALICNSANQAYASAFKRLNNICTEYRGNVPVRTFSKG